MPQIESEKSLELAKEKYNAIKKTILLITQNLENLEHAQDLLTLMQVKLLDLGVKFPLKQLNTIFSSIETLFQSREASKILMKSMLCQKLADQININVQNLLLSVQRFPEEELNKKNELREAIIKTVKQTHDLPASATDTILKIDVGNFPQKVSNDIAAALVRDGLIGSKVSGNNLEIIMPPEVLVPLCPEARVSIQPPKGSLAKEIVDIVNTARWLQITKDRPIGNIYDLINQYGHTLTEKACEALAAKKDELMDCIISLSDDLPEKKNILLSIINTVTEENADSPWRRIFWIQRGWKAPNANSGTLKKAVDELTRIEKQEVVLKLQLEKQEAALRKKVEDEQDQLEKKEAALRKTAEAESAKKNSAVFTLFKPEGNCSIQDNDAVDNRYVAPGL